MTLTDFSDTQDIMGSPKDLAIELGPDGIGNLLHIIYKSYKNLYARGGVLSKMGEIDITEEIYVELQIIWKKEGTTSSIPIHEKPDRAKSGNMGKPPSIDFCFRNRYVKESYFGAECKLLKENDKSYKQYVSEGVNRYLEGKYGKNCSTGSMIGYITTGDVVKIMDGVKIKVDEVSDISKMERSHPINGFTEHYESKHKRDVGCTPFCIHHLFFSFANITT